MKTIPLNYGVKVVTDLSNSSVSELKDIINICMDKGLVVLENQNISIERFDELNEIWGRHQLANCWANHKNFPKIFRVTNKNVQRGKKGFFHGQKLEWHYDGIFIQKPEECVSLWCVEPSKKGGDTYFACGLHAYNSLKAWIKDEISNARLTITSDISKTYLKQSPFEPFLDHEKIDFDKINLQHKKKNKDEEMQSKESLFAEQKKQGSKVVEIKRKKIEKPLLIRHPSSRRLGLNFPFYFVEKINDLKHPDQSKKIFHILVKHYVGRKGLFYKHKWKRGDLLLCDQIHSLHRRTPYFGNRELYRTAFWYHENDKKAN